MTVSSVELSGLHIYPVKSLRGVSVREARLENGRLAGDRTWLLVDAGGRFMHQRDYPQMTRVAATLTDRGIVVSTGGMGPLEIERPSLTKGSGVLAHVQLWRRSAPVVPASPDADAWF